MDNSIRLLLQNLFSCLCTYVYVYVCRYIFVERNAPVNKWEQLLMPKQICTGKKQLFGIDIIFVLSAWIKNYKTIQYI